MTYGGLVSFGDYSFGYLQEYSDNFADTVPELAKLPGMDGGFDLYGDQAAPAPTGKVQMGFYLIADTRAEMDALRDSVRALAYMGIQKLKYQPTDAADPVRWTWARLNNPQMSQKKHQHTDLWQPVKLIFQCPEPVWWVDSYVSSWQIGNGTKLGDPGVIIGGGGYAIAASGTTTDDTVTQNGNTESISQIVVEPGVGDSCENVKIQRIIGTAVLDEVAYTGTLSAGDTLVINGRTQTITVNGTAAWDSITYRDSKFLRLPPGNSTIRIIFANAGDAATVTLYYQDSYR